MKAQEILSQLDTLRQKGYETPGFDMARTIRDTTQSPRWIHFGAGNIFRAFLSVIVQHHLNHRNMAHGIIAAEGYDHEIIDKIYEPMNNLGLVAIMGADGTIEKKLIGSVTEALRADQSSEDWNRLLEIFTAPSLQMASFTITEKGYNLYDAAGNPNADVQQDFLRGPGQPQSYIGKIAALMHHRYVTGKHPIALVSMDNCSKNGERLQKAVTAFAAEWCRLGLVDGGFLGFIQDDGFVSFPWTMIDKITPRPDAVVQALFEQDGFEDIQPVITAKNTYIAPFANAEKTQYLIIENAFPAGKPLPEGLGVFFTTREQVSKAETMKVTTCLNPLHTSLAVFGCLLGFRYIADEMKDEDLCKMVRHLGYEEGLPVVVQSDLIDPAAFINEVLTERFPNPFVQDTPQRIATDTSQKLAIRFGETIKQYLRSGRDVASLTIIPLVFAGWLRYLLGVDDAGLEFSLSPDPRLHDLLPRLRDISLGGANDCHHILAPILGDETIFGLNLYEAGLGQAVERLFHEMIRGTGCVRSTLRRVVEAL